MDTIKIEAMGARIGITCRREVGDIAKVRWLSGHEAVALGLLLASKAPECHALNVDVNPEVSVQIINAPYEEAWLSVRDLRGERTLAVGIRGKIIKQIGRHLLRLSNAALGSPTNKPTKPFVRRVWQSYLEEAE